MQIFLIFFSPLININDKRLAPWKISNRQHFMRGQALKMYRPIVVIVFILLTLAALLETGMITFG